MLQNKTTANGFMGNGVSPNNTFTAQQTMRMAATGTAFFDRQK